MTPIFNIVPVADPSDRFSAGEGPESDFETREAAEAAIPYLAAMTGTDETEWTVVEFSN